MNHITKSAWRGGYVWRIGPRGIRPGAHDTVYIAIRASNNTKRSFYSLNNAIKWLRAE